MRVAVIGRGRWGANIVNTLATMGDVEVIEESKDLDLARQQQPDGVLIAIPAATHADVAIPFIDAGVPTFIEKPMATTVADAIRIRGAASRSGTPVVVGHVHLHNPAFQALKKLLTEVGAAQAVYWEDEPSSTSRYIGVVGLASAWALHGAGATRRQSCFCADLVCRRGIGVQGGNCQVWLQRRPVHRERKLALNAKTSWHDDCVLRQLDQLRRYRAAKAVIEQFPRHLVPDVR